MVRVHHRAIFKNMPIMSGIDTSLHLKETAVQASLQKVERRIKWLTYWELRCPSNFLARAGKCKTEAERKRLKEIGERILVSGGMKHNEIIEFMQLRKARAHSRRHFGSIRNWIFNKRD